MINDESVTLAAGKGVVGLFVKVSEFFFKTEQTPNRILSQSELFLDLFRTQVDRFFVVTILD